ncbi:hypothetical protein BJX76DRAFT_334268 [Aspergillus varians]
MYEKCYGCMRGAMGCLWLVVVGRMFAVFPDRQARSLIFMFSWYELTSYVCSRCIYAC